MHFQSFGCNLKKKDNKKKTAGTPDAGGEVPKRRGVEPKPINTAPPGTTNPTRTLPSPPPNVTLWYSITTAAQITGRYMEWRYSSPERIRRAYVQFRVPNTRCHRSLGKDRHLVIKLPELMGALSTPERALHRYWLMQTQTTLYLHLSYLFLCTLAWSICAPPAGGSLACSPTPIAVDQ